MRKEIDDVRASVARALKRGGELTTLQIQQLTGCTARFVQEVMRSPEFEAVQRSARFIVYKLRTENADEQDNGGTCGAVGENPAERKEVRPAVKRDFRFGKATYRENSGGES